MSKFYPRRHKSRLLSSPRHSAAEQCELVPSRFSESIETKAQAGRRGDTANRISPFSDQIPTAHRPHLCRMHGPGRNVAAASRSIRVRPAVHGQCHLAAQYDVRGLRVMPMLRIKRVRSILPNIGMAKSLAVQLLRQLSLVQTRVPPFVEGSVPFLPSTFYIIIVAASSTFLPPNTVTPLPH
jgi:hypothetical protein